MGRSERDQVRVRDRQDECWQNRQEDAPVRSELRVRTVTRGAVQLVDADVRIIVIMEAESRVVDLDMIVELVERALEESSVKEVGVDAISVLDDLQREVTVILEALATHDFAIL